MDVLCCGPRAGGRLAQLLGAIYVTVGGITPLARSAFSGAASSCVSSLSQRIYQYFCEIVVNLFKSISPALAHPPTLPTHSKLSLPTILCPELSFPPPYSPQTLVNSPQNVSG